MCVLHIVFQSTIDVLKIDIEYSEWEALNAMFLEGSLRNVKQLVFEIHTKELYGQTHSSTIQDLVYYWQILSNVEKLGFRRWHTHMNMSGRYKSARTRTFVGCCYELYYVNLNYMT